MDYNNLICELRTFALIISAHPYYARKFTPRHRWARALSIKINNDREDGHAAALPGFNDLGRSVTPTFLFRNRFYSQLSQHCPKMNKKSMWEAKKKFKISVHGTSNPGILRLQGAWNYGRLIRACSLRNLTSLLISLSRSTWTILGREHITSKVQLHYSAVFANEARFFRFRVIFQACSLLNEVGDPQFCLHFWHK